MREKRFAWDGRDAPVATIATIATIAIITTLLVPAVFAPPVIIVNTLAAAVVLRAGDQRNRRGDLVAALVAGAAVLGVVVAPAVAPAVGIANALLITLSLRLRR